MKRQLEELASEMVQEIKNLKDLTKKELPEIAKEYINFNTTTSWIIAVVTGLVMFGGLIGWYYAYNLSTDSYSLRDERLGWLLLTIAIAIISAIVSIIHWYCYLEFKLQPRRKAIQAITSLLP